MRKRFFLPCVFALFIIFTGCEDEKNEVTLESVLKGSWTQSYEEQTSVEIEIFRHSNSKDFPLSRYRQVFIFEENNQCQYLVLAPNDAHYVESGFWEFDEKSNIIKIFNLNFELLFQFEAVEFTDSLLKLRAIK